MSDKTYLNDLQDIAKKKQELKAKIELQERKLSKDLDAYQDDIETFKKTWSSLKSVRNFGQNFSISGISQAFQAVRALPIGKSSAAKATSKSKWLTVFTLGAELVNFIIQRRKKKKSKLNN